MNLEAIQTILSLTPCWKIIHCPMDVREKCDAFSFSSIPCWLIKDKGCGKHIEDCRLCDVYLSCPEALEEPKQFLKKFIAQ